MAHYIKLPEAREHRVKLSIISTHKGWTIARHNSSGLMFIFRPNGTKYGQTQTEAAARIMRSRAIQGAAATVHEEGDHKADQEVVDCDVCFPPLPRCQCGNPRSPQMDLCPDCHSARLDRESPRIAW